MDKSLKNIQKSKTIISEYDKGKNDIKINLNNIKNENEKN
jgi:hypothetical protein